MNHLQRYEFVKLANNFWGGFDPSSISPQRLLQQTTDFSGRALKNTRQWAKDINPYNQKVQQKVRDRRVPRTGWAQQMQQAQQQTQQAQQQVPKGNPVATDSSAVGWR